MKENPTRVIVGVDYSDASIEAIQQAWALISGRGGGTLWALLVLPGGPTTSPPEAVEASDQLIARLRENLQELVRSRRSDLVVVPCEVRGEVRYGKPAAQILEFSKELDADAIVVGNRGRRGVERLLLGSVASEVASDAECSVLVARLGHSHEEQPAGAETFEPDPGAAAATEGEPLEAGDVVVEPHIEGTRVVSVVLDAKSGRTFLCTFETLRTLRVEALEGDWLVPATSEQRARAARTALALARSDPDRLEQLLAEAARRRHES